MIPKTQPLGPMKWKDTWMGLSDVTLLLEGVPLTLTGARIYLTVYTQKNAAPVFVCTNVTPNPDIDPSVPIAHNVVIDSSGNFFDINHTVCPLRPGVYWYEIVVNFANGMVETPYQGSWTVV